MHQPTHRTENASAEASPRHTPVLSIFVVIIFEDHIRPCTLSPPKHFSLKEICEIALPKIGANISIPIVAHISQDATRKHHPTAYRLEAYLLRHRMRKQ